MKWLVRLYPRAWRQRYGGEFVALLAQQRLSPRIILDIVLGALDAHVHPQVSAARLELAGGGLAMTTQIARHAAILERSQWFRGMDLEPRLQLAEVTEERSYHQGEVILRKGDPLDGMYIITSGTANVVGPHDSHPESDEHTVLVSLPTGEAFAESALILGGDPASATVVASGSTDCLFVPRDAFVKTFQAAPDIALAIMGALVERLRQADGEIQSLRIQIAGSGPAA